jgi:aerobic C4-dicarboxylate transport protein
MAFTIGKFGLGSLVNLASWWAFYITSLLFVLVILGFVAACAASPCSS